MSHRNVVTYEVSKSAHTDIIKDSEHNLCNIHRRKQDFCIHEYLCYDEYQVRIFV